MGPFSPYDPTDLFEFFIGKLALSFRLLAAAASLSALGTRPTVGLDSKKPAKNEIKEVRKIDWLLYQKYRRLR